MSLTASEWEKFLQIQGHLTAEQDRQIVKDYRRLEERLALLDPLPAQAREALEEIKGLEGLYLPNFYARVMAIVNAAKALGKPVEQKEDHDEG